MAKRTLDDIFEDDPLGLLNVENKHKNQHHSESYLLTGFNEIQVFFERTGRVPEFNGSGRIEELRLATRLDTFRKNNQVAERLTPYDKYQLLVSQEADNINDEIPPASIDDILDSELLGMSSNDIFDIRHVTVTKTQSVNTYTANRKPCVDFERFQTAKKKKKKKKKKNWRNKKYTAYGACPHYES